mmetsp:Transcript_9361/g.17463  ORF Transcript_9361/g.17463 Transcript_9361/m.17463 type:complete len:602 (-) Transcript_9361:155-1960(-)
MISVHSQMPQCRPLTTEDVVATTAPSRRIYLNNLPEVEAHYIALLHQNISSALVSQNFPADTAYEITTRQNNGFIQISLCDEDAYTIAMTLNTLPIILPDIFLLANVPKCKSKKTTVTTNKTPKSSQELVEQSLLRQTRKEQKLRRRNKRNQMLESFFSTIPTPGGNTIATQYKTYSALTNADEMTTGDYLADKGSIDWSSVPRSVDPGFNYSLDTPLGENLDIELKHHDSVPRNGDDVIVGRSSARITTSQGQCRGLTTRAVRKRAQIESFALVLRPIISMLETSGRRLCKDRKLWHVVDFGSGSGNLCLALAFLFPNCHFTAVDFKSKSVEILNQRAAAANLSNVSGIVGKIEDFKEKFDVALALHACGKATDFGLQQAKRCRAAYAVCPCCVGNLKYSPPRTPSLVAEHDECCGIDMVDIDIQNMRVNSVSAGCSGADMDSYGGVDSPCALDVRDEVGHTHATGRDKSRLQGISSGLDDITELSHPRSEWLNRVLKTSKECNAGELYAALARAGDIAHGSAHSSTQGSSHTHEEVARLCKSHLEMDRNMHMQEYAYQTALMRILLSDLTGKGDLLVGVPKEWGGPSSGSSISTLPWVC